MDRVKLPAGLKQGGAAQVTHMRAVGSQGYHGGTIEAGDQNI